MFSQDTDVSLRCLVKTPYFFRALEKRKRDYSVKENAKKHKREVDPDVI